MDRDATELGSTARNWRIIALPLVAFVLIIADQLSKHYAVGLGTYVLNTGISFGLLKGIGSINTIMTVVASLALLMFIYLLAFRNDEFHSQIGLLLLISGTAGNLIDRITYGAVIDFIDIGSFPTFNLADAYLSVGIVLILFMSMRWERRHPDAAANK